ncbi:N-acetyl sugar amidotransferase [Gammaproteobacteria bacterium]|nr:N-acetyl sugar amidotransferase [Gammaproteobacteria bacterium]
MSEVSFCTRCVISTLRPTSTIEGKHKKNEEKPTTQFANGICDACRWAVIKETEIDWTQRASELHELCDKNRKGNGEYDVVVPASGGKDSMYVAHVLKHKYKMNPLTVTWAPNIWTEIGQKNHLNLIKSGFNNLLISPNGKVHRKLTRFAFEIIGHPFQPFIFGQRSVGPKVALQHDIKLIFYGENVAEYGNNIKDNYSPIMDPRLYTCYDIDDQETRLGGMKIKDLYEQHGFERSDLIPYRSPSLETVTASGLQVHYMSYYKKWVPQENFYYAMKNTMFEPAETRTTGSYSKYSGLDDKLEWLHFYMMFIKFGMGRATADAAQEIRSDKITRDEGVKLVELYDSEFPTQHVGTLCEYMDLSEDEFYSIIDSFRSEKLWEKVDGKWLLKHHVY